MRACKYCQIELARGTVQAHEKACEAKPPKPVKPPKAVPLYRCPVCESQLARGAFAAHVRGEHP